MSCAPEFVFNPFSGQFEFVMLEESASVVIDMLLVDRDENRLQDQSGNDLITQGP